MSGVRINEVLPFLILFIVTIDAGVSNKKAEPSTECLGDWGNYYNGSCYLVLDVNYNLRQPNKVAMEICEEMGTKLMSVETREEVNQLGIYINNTLKIGRFREFWIDRWYGERLDGYPEECFILTNWNNRFGDTSIYSQGRKSCSQPRNWICKGDIDHVNDYVQMEQLRQNIRVLSKQIMSQNLAFEERIRSEGDSGLKQVRHTLSGSRTYHSETHTGNKMAAMHDHSNNIRTVGLGEFSAVLNGVEFRTRHNDFRMNMPSRTDPSYGAMEDVPFPPVPPSVLNKPDLQQQLDEMREYFRAWGNQDTNIRDYRPYFKPVLCYLEGQWTNTGEDIDEPFYSDRHFLDAATWRELEQKVRFTSYTGSKSLKENYSYLPARIQKLFNDTFPIFVQWNYRIACHPISRDIPFNRFRMVDDVASRMAFKKTTAQHAMTRAARFELNQWDENNWRDDGVFWRRTGLLDQLMSEIPGRDNYMADLVDNAFGIPAEGMESGSGPINAGFYHRWYKTAVNDAMGVGVRSRGYSDSTVFMAMTNQSKVASMELDDECNAHLGVVTCKHYSQRWSYAIPLEIIYLTPLNAWNPYDLEYKGNAWTPYGRKVEAGGRNGGTALNKAYNGTNSKVYYLTPQEFFTGDTIGKDPADTARGSAGVLDKQGVVRAVRASGMRIFFPNIPGVGTLRQRWPIMPVHGEGSAVWKELEAIKDILFNPQKYRHMYPDGGNVVPPVDGDLTLQVAYTTSDPPGPHSHIVTLTEQQAQDVRNGQSVVAFTSEDNSHQHQITIRYQTNPSSYFIAKCDGVDTCWDRHAPTLTVVSAYDTAL
ncbi:unnamed protein product [Owenia fusiformis]|uniref:Uncharacterized protein n=1 Tax=Owenia fusiformis TaxID=6347 RepID=A0A8J1UYE5_OWEFU|nr:unnamed protein product [Owenia fusiformis]